MKKETIKKYENFLAACRKESIILNIRQLAKAHSVSVTFTDWLIKNRYLVKMAGGSYKYMAGEKLYSGIVRLYENRNEPKHTKPGTAEFANPLSIKCADSIEREMCEKLLNQIGYKFGVNRKIYDSETLIVTNYSGESDKYVVWVYDKDYEMGRCHIDHFNADLIRDIASVRTGDVWVKGEPWCSPATVKYSTLNYATGGIKAWAGEKVGFNSARRPTIAEICDHYGYELNGMNIVKKSEAVESHTSEIVSEYDKMEVNRAEKTKLTPLEEHEDKIIRMLKSIEFDHGVSYSLTRTKTTKTVLL